MADIATLGLKIETGQVAAAIKSLDRLQQAGDRAEKSTKNLEDSSSRMGRAMGQAGGMVSSTASQLAGVVGVTLSVAGAFYAAEKAVSQWYGLISRGVGIVDDYQKQIVGTSYILTTMSNVPPPNLGMAYGEWKNYFTWLYQQSLEADKKSAASAQEIFGVSVELAKKGVVAASKEEMDTIGRLTDLMKAVTPTYMGLEKQARVEIEAMLAGTTRMGAQLAIVLSQIDPLFKKNIASARQQGTELEYIKSILPQIRQYTLDLMGTWDAVSASLKSAWQVINIKAFGDAHRDVVGFASQLAEKLVQNGQLTAEGERAALALGTAWSAAKEKAAGLLDYVINNAPEVIKDVETIASAVGTISGAAISATKNVAQMMRELQEAADNPAVLALLGAAGGSRFGLPGAVIGGAGGALWGMGKWNERQKKEFLPYGPYGEAAETFYGIESKPSSPFAPTHPGLRLPGDTDKGRSGGKGIEAAQNSLARFIDTMTAETARGAGDTETILNSWYAKQSTTLEQMAAKGIDVTRGKEALDTAYYSKLISVRLSPSQG